MINRENQLMHYVKHGHTELAFDYFIDNYSTNTYAKLAHLDGLRSLKNNAIVLCTLLTRAALGGGVDEALAFSRSDQFIIDIEAVDKNEQIAFLMCDMVKLFAELVSDKILSNQSNTIDHILRFIEKTGSNIAVIITPIIAPTRSISKGSNRDNIVLILSLFSSV